MDVGSGFKCWDCCGPASWVYEELRLGVRAGSAIMIDFVLFIGTGHHMQLDNKL